LLGEVPWLGSGVYSASKAAIELAIEGLALELAPLGVKVTIVAPGIMATDFAATAIAYNRIKPTRPRLEPSSEISQPNREKLSGNHPAS
jgi:short-subunit dehydrogenase